MVKDTEPPAPSDNNGESPGEGIHPPEYKSPIALREQAEKQEGNPKEKQAEAERISRDEGRCRQGFPVAGHGERHRDNDRER